ncbi:MAG: phage tail protein [Clostridia bacterium]|nr:phage tail protein [Clostridia bacterium]
MQKVKFGFKNAYYAKITEADGTITYGTPVKLNGAVSMSLAAAGELVQFYADDGLYFSDNSNNGYDGTLELALVPDDFKTDILGETLDTNKVLIENAIGVSNPFALLCEFTTDNGAKKFAFYNCIASRPELAATTKGETKEVSTETLNLTIRPNKEGLVKVSTTDQTSTEVVNKWYTEVYKPVVEG